MFIICLIQFALSDAFEYIVAEPGKAHSPPSRLPSDPKLVAPRTSHTPLFSQTKGPPLSPYEREKCKRLAVYNLFFVYIRKKLVFTNIYDTWLKES